MSWKDYRIILRDCFEEYEDDGDEEEKLLQGLVLLRSCFCSKFGENKNNNNGEKLLSSNSRDDFYQVM